MRLRGSLVIAVLALSFVACGPDLADDPADWDGAPWGLEDVRLPDDTDAIMAWFDAVHDPAFSTLPPFRLSHGDSVALDVSWDDGTQGEVDASRVPPEDLDTRGAGEDVVVSSVDPSTDVGWVATAFELSSQSGYHAAVVELWFGPPGGPWLFSLYGSDPDHLRQLAHALAATAAGIEGS